MESGSCPKWAITVSLDRERCCLFLTELAFNAFGCKYNEEKLLAMAHSMVDEGLVEAGYNSIIFDDCFTKKERGQGGKLLEGICLAKLCYLASSSKRDRSCEVSVWHANPDR